ncbi:alpha/beta fold hydrolase [Nakamurella endophytica]|uniref:Hydrolase n=1 Tax=Nakamurella endophytica TaxID=1748367 RepID=A0A917SRX7_9ACTN|nr:alpha/beta hydrolase [Nakamurella endophytica]GGL96083.1 hydrolase [Nakamurella endophytica]
MTTSYLPLDGGRIAYTVDGTGPLVLCLPGMGDVKEVFRFTVPALTAAGYQVVCADLRGHGESDATFDRYDDETVADDVLALIDALDGGPAVLVGNSLAGAVGALAAVRRPSALAGLVLLSPFLRDGAGGRLARWVTAAALARPWGPRFWTSWYRRLNAGAQPVDLDRHRAALHEAVTRPGHWRALQRLAGTSHDPATAVLDRVRVPALLVQGALDPDFRDPEAEARWGATQLGAEVVMIPDAGHYPQAQQPGPTNEAVLAFLRRVHPADGTPGARTLEAPGA